MLTEEAYERLKTIGEATDLGSGFKIAMRDLEIRGAGNLLGQAQSGHIAGIVNPPSKQKYGHYTNDAPMTTPEEFLAGATFRKESWWPRWGEWLAGQSGKKRPARTPGGPDNPVLALAPGTYVSATPKPSITG